MTGNVEDLLFWRLVSDPRTAIFFGFRVVPVLLEQGVPKSELGEPLPFATYRMLNNESEETLDRADNDETTVMEVVVYAPTHPRAKAAAKAVRAVLKRATESGFGVTLQLVLKNGEQDDVAVPVNGKESLMYAVEMQFSVMHEA